MGRTCERCNKHIKTNRGVSLHFAVCASKVVVKRKPWARNYQELHSRLGAGSPSLGPGHQSTWNGKEDDEGISAGPHEDSDPEDIWQDIPRRPEIHQDDRGLAMYGPSQSRSVSSGASTTVHKFSVVERRDAGTPCPLDPNSPGILARDSEAPLRHDLLEFRGQQLPGAMYFPFRNAAEFELAYYLFESRATAGSIDKFFKLPGVGDILSYVTQFKSVQHYHRTLEEIPYGIPADYWKTETKTEMIAGVKHVWQVKYRDAMAAIRFLIGHQPFAPNLAYAPVRIFDNKKRTHPMKSLSREEDDGVDKSERIYNEMHTGDWWWEVQKTMPPGATIVPVILATDKTTLTQHHGDKSAWPVYVTIGNLDKATRRSQQRPSKLLLGWLPIPSKGLSREVKIEIYHWAMGIIMKRKSNPFPL
jgi:hypothetical protein